MKELDLSKKVAELLQENPEVVDVMVELGFGEITNPVAQKTVGKIMTIPMGAQVKGISMEKIIQAFEAHGFSVSGIEDAALAAEDISEFVNNDDAAALMVQTVTESMPSDQASAAAEAMSALNSETAAKRHDLLKSMIKRLSAGESLDEVRKDFVEHFASVSVKEIADVEQKLIEEGMAVSEVQQLCDVHSALFHGRTDDEICAAMGVTSELAPGHPVSVLKAENTGLIKVLDTLEPMLNEQGNIDEIRALLTELKAIKSHYGKKEELLMPLLYNYGFTGPSDVMWGVDDEIYKEISELAREVSEETWPEVLMRTQTVVTRMREMIYKEEQIFFPLALEHLTNEEWYATYRDLEEFGWAFIDGAPQWIDGDVWVSLQPKPINDGLVDGKIHLETGELAISELSKIFKLLPIDLTYIDNTETTRFFTNEGKVFARPLSCLGREIWSCHPPAIIPMVKTMLASFKNKEIDHMVMWTPSPENPVRVEYHAVFDDDDNYIGCLEMVQKFGAEDLDKFREILAV